MPKTVKLRKIPSLDHAYFQSIGSDDSQQEIRLEIVEEKEEIPPQLEQELENDNF